MKILYVSMDNTPWGGRSHEVKVAEQMAIDANSVTLLVEREPRWEGMDYRPRGMRVKVEPVNQDREARRIAGDVEGEHDVGFASSVSGAPIVQAWMSRTGKPGVAQVLDVPLWRLEVGDRGPWLDSWRPWFHALMGMTRIVANTDKTRQDLLRAAEIYGVSREKVPPVDVVYYGIDVEAADSPLARHHGVERNVSGGLPRAVGVSRLVPYKGFDLAIASLALISPETRPTYHVVGAGEDAERLWQLMALSGVAGRLHGGVSDEEKFGIVRSCDVGLFLAFNQSIPAQFPMEAAYCGLTTVCADMLINRERFQGNGVVYVNPFDTHEVASAVSAVLQQGSADPEPTRRWIRENRSFKSHSRGVQAVLEAVRT